MENRHANTPLPARTVAEEKALQALELALDGDTVLVLYLLATIRQAETSILKLQKQLKSHQPEQPTPIETMQAQDYLTLLAMTTFTLMVGPQLGYWITAEELLDLSFFVLEKFEPSSASPFTHEQMAAPSRQE